MTTQEITELRVSLQVSDLERAVALYRDALGMQSCSRGTSPPVPA